MKQVAIFHLLITIFSATTVATELPAIFVFGDSSADVGNNNFLSGDAPKANYPPYGIDYPGGTPTGRFSNGFIGIDYIDLKAKAIGHEESPPPFLAFNDFKLKNLLRGVNFASGGSGILDTTGREVITMSKQIVDFQSVAESISSQIGKPSADLFLAKSLFFISIGRNDLFAKFALSDPKNDSQRDEIITPIINTFKDQLLMLYKLGARMFAVEGTGLIGCVPGARNPNPPNDCNENLNALSLRFQNATEVLLEQLSSELLNYIFSSLDFSQMMSGMSIYNSLSAELEAASPCCKSVTPAFTCNPNSTYCSDRAKYIFIDAIHITQVPIRTIFKSHLSRLRNSAIGKRILFSQHGL